VKRAAFLRRASSRHRGPGRAHRCARLLELRETGGELVVPLEEAVRGEVEISIAPVIPEAALATPDRQQLSPGA